MVDLSNFASATMAQHVGKPEDEIGRALGHIIALLATFRGSDQAETTNPDPDSVKRSAREGLIKANVARRNRRIGKARSPPMEKKGGGPRGQT